MSIQVKPVITKAEREQFLRLPWQLYKDVKNWVPNPLILQRDVVSPKQNPFFEHGEAQLFLALCDGAPVGRISAQIDHRHIEHYNDGTGFFGFYESVDDAEVSQALLAAAEAWLLERGMERARGPLSFSMDEEAGLMVEGFDQPAMISMPYALAYYQPLIEAQGYEKAMDLYAYRWDVRPPPERVHETVAKTRA